MANYQEQAVLIGLIKMNCKGSTSLDSKLFGNVTVGHWTIQKCINKLHTKSLQFIPIPGAFLKVHQDRADLAMFLKMFFIAKIHKIT